MNRRFSTTYAINLMVISFTSASLIVIGHIERGKIDLKINIQFNSINIIIDHNNYTKHE